MKSNMLDNFSSDIFFFSANGKIATDSTTMLNHLVPKNFQDSSFTNGISLMYELRRPANIRKYQITTKKKSVIRMLFTILKVAPNHSCPSDEYVYFPDTSPALIIQCHV